LVFVEGFQAAEVARIIDAFLKLWVIGCGVIGGIVGSGHGRERSA
jgi:hypothetical protein